MMINNAGDVFQLCISTKREQKPHNLQRSKQINMHVKFHINDFLNDS